MITWTVKGVTFCGNGEDAASFANSYARPTDVVSHDWRDAISIGTDVHASLASQIFQTGQKQAADDQKRAAKAIDYGPAYGAEPSTLQVISDSDCTPLDKRLRDALRHKSRTDLYVKEYGGTLSEDNYKPGIFTAPFGTGVETPDTIKPQLATQPESSTPKTIQKKERRKHGDQLAAVYSVLHNAANPMTGGQVADLAGVPKRYAYNLLSRDTRNGTLERIGHSYRIANKPTAVAKPTTVAEAIVPDVWRTTQEIADMLNITYANAYAQIKKLRSTDCAITQRKRKNPGNGWSYEYSRMQA